MNYLGPSQINDKSREEEEFLLFVDSFDKSKHVVHYFVEIVVSRHLDLAP